MTESLTKADLQEATRDVVHTLGAQLQERFGRVDDQLVTIGTKLDAIMSGEVLVTKEQLLRLVRHLKAAGVRIEESDIFPPALPHGLHS